jgi:hypothetical protein
MTLSQLARLLGKAATITRDVNAIKRGRVQERIYNRAIGRVNSRIMRKFWRWSQAGPRFFARILGRPVVTWPGVC